MEREVQSSINAVKSKRYVQEEFFGKYKLRQIHAGKCKINGGYGRAIDTDS